MQKALFSVTKSFKENALHWADKFPFVSFLDSNEFENYPFSGFRKLLAVGNIKIQFESANNLDILRKKPVNDWWFGYLGYDLTPQSGTGHLNKNSFLDFPEVVFFKAEVVIEWITDFQISIESSNPDEIFSEIEHQKTIVLPVIKSLEIQGFKTKTEYIENIEAIRNQIEEGQFYELNYCQFFEMRIDVDGLSAYSALNEKSPMPFSGWMKAEHLEIACASPERYLKMEGNQLISQPIKGSARRKSDPEEDEKSKQALLNSEKERAENMMIVDLVRNDLARISETGTTTVFEMFGIYSFRHIHQMISTVCSNLKAEKDWVDAIESTFPMGSMTGAPKLEVMSWIEKLETHRRGAFSGALGYISPGNDFDFNVIIRSLFINHQLNKTGFAVGSAITYDSVAEAEWAECETKALAILEVLGADWSSIKGI